MLAASAVAWVVVLLVYFGLLTALSAYPGPLVTPRGSFDVSTDEQVAWAEAGQCRRVGPISDAGFGFWWTCSAVIHASDGRVVSTELRSSTLTPGDTGNRVELVESCGSGDRCSYGRPGYGGWMFPMKLTTYLLGIIIAFAFLGSCICLVGAVLGPRRRPMLMRLGQGANELGDVV
jgi:hypothetical protein